MKKILALSLLFCTVLIFFQRCKKTESLDNIDCSTVNAKYTSDIRPLVNTECSTVGCHAAGSTSGDFTTYSGLKAAADNGGINRKVIDNNLMPPGSGLSLEKRKQFKCWISNGSQND